MDVEHRLVEKVIITFEEDEVDEVFKYFDENGYKWIGAKCVEDKLEFTGERETPK